MYWDNLRHTENFQHMAAMIIPLKELGSGQHPWKISKICLAWPQEGECKEVLKLEKIGMNLCREQLRGEQPNCSSLDLKGP